MATELAGKAHERRLTVYAGAGISASAPTSLPGAAGLAHLIYDALKNVMDLSEVDGWDLLQVADAVAAQPRGVQLLRQTVLDVADFSSAHPNYAHEVLALLLSEGAVTVLETNYDDCIERAAIPERLPVVRTAQELLSGPTASLLKAHGCVTLPSTMLITTADLAAVQFWANASVKTHLSQDLCAFIGIGSVADYVRDSLGAVMGAVGDDHVILVGPGLEAWETDPDLDWRSILPDLPSDQRDTRGASEFCDALLRAYLLNVRRELRALTAGFPSDHPQAVGVETLVTAVESLSAVQFLRWLRQSFWKLGPGKSAAVSAATIQGLTAVGGLLGRTWKLHFSKSGWLSATRDVGEGETVARQIHVLVLHLGESTDGSSTIREARRRVNDAKAAFDIPAESDVLVVAAGVVGSLGEEEIRAERDADFTAVLVAAHQTADGLPGNLLGSIDSDHLIDGVGAGRFMFVNAHLVGQACR